MRTLNIHAAMAALSTAAAGARAWAANEAAANGGTLQPADADQLGTELSAIGALQDELGARALELETVIGMLEECEIALRQMSDATPANGRPIYDAREHAAAAIRKARRDLEAHATAAATAGRQA